MVEVRVADLAGYYEIAVEQLRAVAERLPGSFVVRNQVGNLAIIRADGAYAGYVDVLTGEVVAFDSDGRRLADG